MRRLWNSRREALKEKNRWLLRGTAAISLSLPLQKESFSPKQTKIFFDGLLPEGFTRKTVACWMHLDEEDYVFCH